MKKLLTFLTLCATAAIGLGQGRNVSINPATKKLVYPLPADAAALGEINALAWLKPNDINAQDTNKQGMLDMMAFALARVNSGGTAFFIPDGVYNINCDFTGSIINVPSNTSIRMGKACKLVVDNNGSTERYTMFRFLNSTNCSISGGEIVGDRTTVLAGTNYGFGIAMNFACLNITLSDIVIRDCDYDGLYIFGGSGHKITNVEIFNCRRNNCSITDGQRISFDRCRFSVANGPLGIAAGVDLETETATDVSDISFTDCLFDGNGTTGINIQKGVGVGVLKRVSLLRCTFDDNAGGGILNLRGEDVSVTDCVFRNQTGDNIRFDKLTRGQVSGSRILDGERGVYILASSGIKILNNIIHSSNDTAIDTVDNDPLFPLVNIQIEGNNIQDANGRGIDFRGSYSSITDNFTNRTQSNGILSVGINNVIARNQSYEAGLSADNTLDAITVSGFGHTVTGNTTRKAVVSQTGTATAGGASTITLPVTRSVQDDILNAYKISITAGTGSGQTATISDYVGATGVVTVSAPWSTAPDNTSVYEVIPAGNQQRYGLFTICDRALIMGNDDYLGGKTGASIDQGTNTDTGLSSDIGVATGTSLALSGAGTALGFTATGAGGLSATTGSLNVGSDARATNVTSYMNSAVGFTRFLQYATGGVARWQIGAGNDAESGSDVGTPFRIGAYTDAGAFIDWPVVIDRAAGGPIALSRPTIAPSFSGDGANLTSIAASNITGPFGDISMTGGLVRPGAQTLTPNPLVNDASIEIEIMANNTLTVDSDETFTFPASPPATGTIFGLLLTADTVDRTMTIPSTYSYESGGAVTSFTVYANQPVQLIFQRYPSSYAVSGIPVAAGGGAPTTATYITQTADATLSNEQAMGALATGIVKNTTTTGVQSIAVAGTDYAGMGANTFTGTQNVGSNLIKFGTTVNDSALKHSGTNRELSIRNGDDTLYNYLRLRGIAVWSGADKISGLDYNNPGLEFISGSMVTWGSSATSLSAADTGIKRNAAGVVEINNGTSATYRDLKLRDIIGTTTNNDAAALSVGEVVTSTVASGAAVSLSTGTAANVTSISLTAGDWDVEANVNFSGAAATVTAMSGGITSTSATVPTDGTEVYSGVQTTVLSFTDTATAPRKRFKLAGTTTVYLVGSSTFSVGTVSAFGSMTARRPR